MSITRTTTSEKVTGPNNPIIPLIATLALALATAGGIWMAHKKLYQDPLDTLGAPSAATQGHATPDAH